MFDERFRDNKGRDMGYTNNMADGRIQYFDHRGIMRAEYRPHGDATFDRQGRFVGNGNLLGMFITAD